MTAEEAPDWTRWRRGPHFVRFIEDLLMHTIARLRPGCRPTRDTHLGDTGLGLDSLERFNLAVAVAEALQLSRIENPERLAGFDSIADWVEGARAAAGTGAAIGFRSSGTTGAPGFVTHSLAALGEEVEELAGTIGPRRRILSAVPAHHIYGFLFTVLLPEQLGASVLDVRAVPAPTVSALAQPADFVIGFPQFWQALTIADWAPDVAGASSGGPLAAGVHEALIDRGLGRLIEVYGSSETAGLGWRDRPGSPYRLFPFWQRESDDVLRRGATRHALPDAVAWQGRAMLIPVARRDGAVQIGGVNVDPQAVRAVLLAHPALADAAVRLMRPEEGDRLKAFVVPLAVGLDPQALRADIEEWLKSRLSPLEQPRAITFGSVLPASGMGKPADWRLP